MTHVQGCLMESSVLGGDGSLLPSGLRGLLALLAPSRHPLQSHTGNRRLPAVHGRVGVNYVDFGAKKKKKKKSTQFFHDAHFPRSFQTPLRYVHLLLTHMRTDSWPSITDRFCGGSDWCLKPILTTPASQKQPFQFPAITLRMQHM